MGLQDRSAHLPHQELCRSRTDFPQTVLLKGLARIAADGLGLELEQMEFRAGTSDLPDAGIAGGSAHTATAGMAIHNAGAAVIAKLADLATTDERSPLFGAGNAGVVARGGRLFRRDDEGRSEGYADILGRAGLDRKST